LENEEKQSFVGLTPGVVSQSILMLEFVEFSPFIYGQNILQHCSKFYAMLKTESLPILSNIMTTTVLKTAKTLKETC
jgi:hypothetical protein